MKGWETGAGGSGRQRRRRPWRQSTALAPPAPPAHLAGGGAIVVPGGQVLGLGGHLVENPGLGALQGERLRREAGAREGGVGGVSTRGGTGNWQRGGLGRACRPGRSLALGHPRQAPQSLTMSCIVPPIQTYLQQEGEAGVRWADGRRGARPTRPSHQALAHQARCSLCRDLAALVKGGEPVPQGGVQKALLPPGGSCKRPTAIGSQALPAPLSAAG